mgnify:FL=1
MGGARKEAGIHGVFELDFYLMIAANYEVGRYRTTWLKTR